MEPYKKIALIDGDFIPYYVCHNKKGEEPKDLEKVLLDCDNLLYKIFVDSRATHYIGFIGEKGKKTFRHALDSNYKANRKGTTPVYFEECRDYLQHKWLFVKAPERLEVDDCVNIIRNKLPQSFIVSPDKDILQLEGKHYNPRKGEWVDNTLMHEEAEFAFWQDMLDGQSGDNIEGIKGVGSATSSRLLNSLNTEETKTILELKALYASYILKLYILKKGEEEGIKDFYLNYQLLKILSKDESLEVPLINEVDLEFFISKQLQNE